MGRAAGSCHEGKLCLCAGEEEVSREVLQRSTELCTFFASLECSQGSEACARGSEASQLHSPGLADVFTAALNEQENPTKFFFCWELCESHAVTLFFPNVRVFGLERNEKQAVPALGGQQWGKWRLLLNVGLC